MKISPIVKKAILIIYFIILLILIVAFTVAAYHSDPLPSVKKLVSIILIFSSITSLTFVFLYFSIKNDFKEFESNFSNLETIIKAIEHSRVENVTHKEFYQIVNLDNGISIVSHNSGNRTLEDVKIPQFSYLYYLISKKALEYNMRIDEERAVEKTQNIINKMKQQSWED